MWRVAHRGKPVVFGTIGRLTRTGFPALMGVWPPAQRFAGRRLSALEQEWAFFKLGMQQAQLQQQQQAALALPAGIA
jgi:hypothetical protein